MKLAYPQLAQHLTKNLAPIYLVSGDELLLAQEAVDALRAAASKAGFSERVATVAESHSDWAQSLYTDTHSISLFASKKVVELNLTHIKLNNTQAKLFAEYACQPPANTLLIIITRKLDTNTEKTAWYKAVEKNGVVLPIWPVPTEQLPQWIRQRAKKINLELTLPAAERLATLVEGNLLAATQEIEKLSLLYPDKTLDHLAIEDVVMDNARFDIFNLVDSALAGDRARCLRILHTLAEEGIEPTLIVWALTREIRVLAEIQQQLQQGIALPTLLNKAGIWAKRQAGFKTFLNHHTRDSCWNLLIGAAKIDRIIKGIEIGNTWNALQAFAIEIATPWEKSPYR